ncbi:hypothetical protein DM02DRAFT_678824 [Periconia macrospinosa]|uniref:Zn(2)-C6 fungal-type domain-containing protein n=1 Tax=Periconia macrospinosa TaxID=97972 RepID=A0A2V1CWM5_9PLEO|nr:hypothetical protein DM02DRAFT_678824 [Periconia macrospinosa]
MSENPCSNCRSRGYPCVVNPANGRCVECLSNSRQCDKVLNWDRIARIDRQDADLRVQLEALERERGQEEKHIDLNCREEAGREDRYRAFLTKSDRLCKRLSQLHSQRRKLLEYEFKSIEELEKLEAEKRFEQASPDPPLPSESSAPEPVPDFDRTGLEDPGFRS